MIRQGFVPNSSSASFLIAGIDVSDIENARGLLCDDLEKEFNYVQGDEWGESGLPKGVAIIGIYLAHFRTDEYLEAEKIDIKEVLRKIEELKNVLQMPSKETVFYQGTCAC